MGSFSISGGVEVYGFISPSNTTDQYPVIDPLYGIDGLRNVNFLSDLDLIPTLRRRAGMLVGVSGGTTYYKLKAGPWNNTITDWELFELGSNFTGGTVTGATIFTNGLTANTISATTYLNLPSDIYVTGYSYSNNTFTIERSFGQPNLLATIDVVTGLTSSGTIESTILSASTYLNLPTDIFVTGGTYSNGSTIFTNNTGGTFNVSGYFTGYTNVVNSLTTGLGLSGDVTTGDVTIVNTAPDQVVTLSGGTNISVSGTYPNFNIEFTGSTTSSFDYGKTYVITNTQQLI
jgi:hypothetical protein